MGRAGPARALRADVAGRAPLTTPSTARRRGRWADGIDVNRWSSTSRRGRQTVGKGNESRSTGSRMSGKPSGGLAVAALRRRRSHAGRGPSPHRVGGRAPAARSDADRRPATGRPRPADRHRTRRRRPAMPPDAAADAEAEAARLRAGGPGGGGRPSVWSEIQRGARRRADPDRRRSRRHRRPAARTRTRPTWCAKRLERSWAGPQGAGSRPAAPPRGPAELTWVSRPGSAGPCARPR